MEKIARDIVHTMQHDYAGGQDKKGWDFPQTLIQGADQQTREEFVHSVRDYLLDFNDYHIQFIDTSIHKEAKKDPGFRVRRYQDHLIVTDILGDTFLEKGMSIYSLGGHSVTELLKIHQRMLHESQAERENWLPVLLRYSYGEIIDKEGAQKSFTYQLVERSIAQPSYTLESVSEETLLLTFSDFANPDAIMTLVLEHQEQLTQAENWIIDVRNNGGGSDSSFYPLMPFLMPEEGVELRGPEDRMLYHCTEANAERALRDLSLDLEQVEDPNARLFLETYQDQWSRHRGKGFVEFKFDAFLPDTFIKGTEYPKSVVVLTDVECASSGESFVELCKKSPKVTVIGRPTLGVNDYTNLVSQEWDEGYVLHYPSSKLARVDDGLGMTGKGIEPHVYIPWTPKHVEVDVDLNNALERLENQLK
ncbi:S41 family peptidase [Alkalicoccobacillus gibsonii]|uniref:S41 family peptidase n=1 Tax=Alkalicoccobacillus gibsonii TaxID=79881 RepID=UPI00193258D2|nr:S41 family peptidase [Alkalicoccobacillus gibsonii]MBM0067467.1 peptidase [Alkalicoccobacillus gibsonii]